MRGRVGELRREGGGREGEGGKRVGRVTSLWGCV